MAGYWTAIEKWADAINVMPKFSNPPWFRGLDPAVITPAKQYEKSNLRAIR